MLRLARFATAVSLIPLAASCFSSRPTFAWETPAPGSEVALPIRVEANTPIVTVTIGGEAFGCIADLGSFDGIALTPAAAARARVAYTGSTRTISDAMGQRAESRQYRIARASIGPLEIRDLTSHEWIAGEGPAANRGVDGVVGFGLLRSFRNEIDLRIPRWTLWPFSSGAPGSDSEWARVETIASSDGVTTLALLDGERIRVIWDTGATRTVVRPAIADRIAGARARVTPHGKLETLDGARLSFGDCSLPPRELLLLPFTEPRVDAIVGMDVFLERAVVIDPEARVLWIHR